jgi:uncharacterized nucleotidyltransferase DUF6036
MEVLSRETKIKRHQLEHIIWAAGAITDLAEFVVIGNQAILGSTPGAPEALSEEADLYPKAKPELSILLDGTIGELSPFHQTLGYYAHGVGPETAILPEDWESRVAKLNNENTNGVTGWCLAPIDIAYSKLAAGRPKDLEYCSVLLAHQLVDPELLMELIGQRGDRLGRVMDERLKRIWRALE